MNMIRRRFFFSRIWCDFLVLIFLESLRGFHFCTCNDPPCNHLRRLRLVAHRTTNVFLVCFRPVAATITATAATAAAAAPVLRLIF